MAKTLLPQKLILEIDGEGLARALLLYRVNDSGALSPAKSVRVTLTAEDAGALINEAVQSAKTSEGI